MNGVRQFNIQLTCFSCCRNSVKTRLPYSLFNCYHTLQVLQQVANLSLKYDMAIKRCGYAYCKTREATFLTEGPGSVRLYATVHIYTCILNTIELT